MERSDEYIACLYLSLFFVFEVVREEFRRLYWLRRFGSGGRIFEAMFCLGTGERVDGHFVEHLFILS